MEKRKYIIFSAVAVTVTFLATLTLGTGISHGRFNNSVSHKVVYNAEAAQLESNYLEKGGQRVLLDDWTVETENTKTENISLSSKSAIQGKLTCSSNSSLISVNLNKSDITVGSGGETAVLTMNLNSSAQEINAKTTVTVRVSFTPNDAGDAEWADFILNLCPENDSGNSVDDASVGLSSNYLTSGGKTVLLSDWKAASSTYKTKDIELITYSGEISGVLKCETNSEYVVATLDDSTGPRSVTVGSNVKDISILKLSLTEAAASIAEKTEVTVKVSWTPESASDGMPTMWVNFKVNLIPADDMATVSGTDSKSITTLSLTECPGSFEWNSSFKVPVRCPVESDSVEITYNGGSFPAGTKYSTDNNTYYTLGETMSIQISSEADGTVELWLNFSDVEYENSGAISLGVTVYSNGIVVANGSKMISPYYNEQEQLPIFDDNAIADEISKSEVILLEIHVPEEATSLELSYNGGAFPKGIRYSLDNKIYTVNEREEKISLSVDDNSDINLFIDLSRINEAYIPDVLAFAVTAYSGIVEIQSEEVTCQTTLAPLSATYDISQMYIGYSGAISFAVEGYGDNVEFLVEHLRKTDDGNKYSSSNDDFGLNIGFADGEIFVSNENEEAAAGTYRLSLIRKQNGVELSRIEIPFFIHY